MIMNVSEWGAPSGAPVWFWPGLNPWGAGQLVEVGPLLAARGLHVRAFAPPWDGAPDDYLPSQLADRIAAAVPDDRFVFMGASWGGSIGVYLAARHPDRVRGLVLVDGGHVDFPIDATREELVERFEADQAAFSFESWDAWHAWVRDRVHEWRPALAERYGEVAMVEERGRIVPRAGARAAAHARWGVAAEPPTAVHERIAAPVLLLLARDGDEPPPTLRAEIRRLDGGHDLIEDCPEETARLVGDWVSNLPAEG
jgi:pimeloyl-ACP methyl ester carboxylesterase